MLNSNKMWCFVLVILSLHQVIARDCFDIGDLNCNDCMRCGGHWCNSPDLNGVRCSISPTPDWCPGYREDWTSRGLGDTTYETSARVGVHTSVEVEHSAIQTLEIKQKKSSQTSDFEVNTVTNCTSERCITSVTASPGTEFCSPEGKETEEIYVTLNSNKTVEEITVKFNVPCSCKCNQEKELKSNRCNHKGDLICGSCSCFDGWSGEFCENVSCDEKITGRGDTTCSNPDTPHDVDCSGNGYCGECETCVCYSDREGYQYFNENYFCSDICMEINSCESCFKDPVLDKLNKKDEFNLFFKTYNETVSREKDTMNRNIWVRCNATLEDNCHTNYFAMKDMKDVTHVMVVDFCESNNAKAGGVVQVKLPIILTIVALAVVAAAAAGYFVFKNRLAPQQPSTSTYTNIEPANSDVLNPIYIPATSKYTNPTYGKW